MKCPKCGYLGFETTDRCRNCQYDFSLAPFASEPDLTLQQDDLPDPTADFDLPAGLTGPADRSTPSGLDLDRLFGDASGPRAVGETPRAAAEPTGVAAPVPAMAIAEPTSPAPRSSTAPAADMDLGPFRRESAAQPAEPEPDDAEDAEALPFEDAPLTPPRAARPPLAVRRSTADGPRNRPRTTRPVKPDAPLSFDLDAKAGVAGEAAETVDSLMETPPLVARIGAGLIDLLLLLAIHGTVLLLTLRIAGLEATIEDARVLPVIPFGGFLAMLAFGYVALFTVACGQTIGKMILKLRVIGDDGRTVDAAGGMLRALGCMLVPLTLGLSYLPALLSSDHRSLHDRLAGTRVVRE